MGSTIVDLYQKFPISNIPNSIRLIILQPGIEGSSIRCDILPISLDSHPVYEALSYTWDLDVPPNPSQPSTYSITISEHPLSVAPNLYFALRRLRHRTETRTLWIDAICINQEDYVEKSQQVQIMSVIYSEASRVIVWLGEEEPLDGHAFALMNKFLSAFPDIHSCTMEEVIRFQDANVKLSEVGWPALGALIRRRWFTRVWVLQEVVMAQEAIIVCGSLTIPWWSLTDVVLTIRARGFGDGLQETGSTSRDVHAGMIIEHALNLKARIELNEKPSLLNALSLIRTLDATNPRDRVYAVLAFVRDEDLMVPDYEISPEELLRKVNLSFVTPGSDLRFLSFFDAKSFKIPGKLTPWAPNWMNAGHDRHAFLSWGNQLHETKANRETYRIEYAATGAHNPQMTLSVDGTKLTLRGIFFDEVAQRSTEFEHFPQQIPHDLLEREKDKLRRIGKYLASCQKVAASAKPLSHPGQTPTEAFWRTLICGVDLKCRIAPEIFAEYYKTCIQLLFQTDTLYKNLHLQTKPLPDFVLENGSKAAKFESAAWNRAAAGRRFCCTNNGYLGMVPVLAKKGDKICAFLGAATPFVVRPKGDGVYQLVGECYVHCMMNGEILKLPNFEERLEDITLG